MTSRLKSTFIRLLILIPLLLGVYETSFAQEGQNTSNLAVSPTSIDVSNNNAESKSALPAQEAKEAKKDEPPSIWYNDRNVIAGIVQATATVIAVFIGFLFSMLAEGRAWRRRKSEQVREKQLTALLAFLTDIQNIIEFSQQIATECRNLSISQLQGDQSGAGKAASEAARATLKSKAEQWFKGLDSERRGALLRFTELRLLQIQENGLQLITQCMSHIDTLLALTSAIRTDITLDNGKEFEDTLLHLTSASDMLVKSAIESLHG